MTYSYRFPVKIQISDLITELCEFVAVAPRVVACAAILRNAIYMKRFFLKLTAGHASSVPQFFS